MQYSLSFGLNSSGLAKVSYLQISGLIVVARYILVEPKLRYLPAFLYLSTYKLLHS